MKAIVQDNYGSAEVLELRDVEKPQPGDDELLIRVHAAGLDPGVWHLMTGLPYLVRLMGFGLRRPKIRIRGTDVAGTVEVAGRNVTQLQPRQRVLVVGAAGGVGTYAVQLAKAFGAVVSGVCSTSKAELVRAIGADEVIDYTREDFTEGTHRYDLILDTAGRRPLSQLRRALMPQGTLVIVGGEGGDRWLGGFQRQIVAPVRALLTEQKLMGLISKERQQDLLTLKDLIEAGKLKPVIDRTYPLREAPQAIRYLEQGHARGKVVLTISE